MLYKHYKKVVMNTFLLMVVILLSRGTAYTDNNLCLVGKEIVVGLLIPEERTYSGKVYLSEQICELFNNLGIKIKMIDYSKIIKLTELKKKSYYITEQNKMLAKKLILDSLEIEALKFLEEAKINRILILGSRQDNLNPESFSLYCFFAEAILKIAADINSDIHILGMNGILQNIINLIEEIEIINIANLTSNKDSYRKEKAKPLDCIREEDISLQKIKIIPNSYLAEVVAKFLLPDENGWILAYFPRTNNSTSTIDNTPENRKKLNLLGYKIAAFSICGKIEAIEDKNNNIYFQNCVEAFLIESNKDPYSSLPDYKARQVSTLVSIAVVSDFLYRI